MRPAPFALERYFAKHEFNSPYLLSSSDSESWSLEEILALEPDSEVQLKKLWLGYTESQGHPELRQSIATLYSNASADDVLVHSGAEEAIFAFMNSVLNTGDHVIVHAPSYQALGELPRAIGCDVTHWVTREDSNWELDIEFLQGTIQSNTRLIVLNCPHNPTGYLMSKDKYKQLIEIARARNIILFSDEVYRYSEYDPADRLDAACDLYENAVSLGVMSKTFGLAGLRIGWVCTKRKDILSRMAEYKDYLTICNSAPSEFLSIIGLKHKDILVKRNVELMKSNLLKLNEFFAQHSDQFGWCPPKAGAIGFPNLRMSMPIEKFCSDILEKKGVLLLPGTTYEFGKNHFRIGFGRKNFSEGLDQLKSYVDAIVS